MASLKGAEILTVSSEDPSGSTFLKEWTNQFSREEPTHSVEITHQMAIMFLFQGLGKRSGQYSFGLGKF